MNQYTLAWMLLIGGVAALAIAAFMLGERTERARAEWRKSDRRGWRDGSKPSWRSRVMYGHVLEVRPSGLPLGTFAAYVDGRHLGSYASVIIAEKVAESELARMMGRPPAPPSAISSEQLKAVDKANAAWNQQPEQPLTFLPRDRPRPGRRNFGFGG